MVLLATTEKGGTIWLAPASTKASRVNSCTIGLPISLLACTHAQTPHAQGMRHTELLLFACLPASLNARHVCRSDVRHWKCFVDCNSQVGVH